MIKYFEELEHPQDQYMDLIEYNDYITRSTMESKTISDEYLRKISKLFEIIDDYDLLHDNHLETKPIYLATSAYDYDYPFTYSWYMEGHDSRYSGLTINGVEKLDFLKDEYLKSYKGLDFNHDFFKYYVLFMDLLRTRKHFKVRLKSELEEDLYDGLETNFDYPDDIIMKSSIESEFLSSKNRIRYFIEVSYQLAMLQNKVTGEDKKIFEDVLKYLYSSKIKLKFEKRYKPCKYELPNAWYITPYNHLYNTMNSGGDGHQEANLQHPFRIVFADQINSNSDSDGYKLLKRAIESLDEGYINISEYRHFTNLIPEFISILPEKYYGLDDNDKSAYIILHRKTYNPRIVKVVAGIMSAQAGLFTKFQHIKDNSSDYARDLEFIKSFSHDEILVRCCGFHKISSVVSKTITTSDLNWEEDFREYIDRGWTIDFVKPIILNYAGILEELPDDFVKLKTFGSK